MLSKLNVLFCRWCLITLSIGLLITAFSTYSLYAFNKKITADFFNEIAHERHQELKSLNDRSTRLLDAFEAMLASLSNIDESSHRSNGLSFLINKINAYVKARNIHEDFPGIFSMGLTLKVSSEDLPGTLAILSQYYPNFQYQAMPGFTTEQHSTHYLVIYSYPDTSSSIGFNSASDPLTLPVIQQAFRFHSLAMSSPLVLVEDPLRKSLSQLYYRPLLYTPEGLDVLAYFSVNFSHLFEGLDRDTSKYQSPKFIRSVVRDSDGKCLLNYISGLGQYSCDEVNEEGLSLTMPWSNLSVTYYPTPQLVANFYTTPIAPFALTGVIITFLLAFLVRTLSRRSEDLTVLVLERTAELDSQRKAAEEAVNATHRFVANMSHELRTPLNGVMGINQILLAKVKEENIRSLVNMSQDSAQHLLGMIEEVLDISKLDNGSFDFFNKPFSFRKGILPVVSFLETRCKAKGIKPIVLMAENIPRKLIADKKRLNQILFNLVGNAVKFTDRGHICLSFDGYFISESQFELTITVEDTGIGIAADQQSFIFTPFKQVDDSSTRRHGGAGLGLAITYQLVSYMGGRIELSSKLGEGSVFCVTLPLEVVTSDNEVASIDKSSNVSLSGMRTVMIDDVATNTQIQSILLEQQGIHVTAFNNPYAAIEYCLANAAAIDAVLCDIQMPDISGLEVAKQLRAQGFNPAIIGLSGNAFAEDIQRATAAGMNDYLTKPLDLLQAIIVLKKYYHPRTSKQATA
jgi:signal transduction histidine kinase/ActR/RegA family two-component response regulator